MMKIVASLLILGLCANVCFANPLTVAPTSSSQSGAFSGLNSTATKVYTASNSTDATNWDSSAASQTVTVATGVPEGNVFFGPGATNDTSYVYGLVPGTNTISKIVKRTVNNTIVGWANDTVEASVVATDSVISSTIVAAGYKVAVGPGYLAILSEGSDGTNYQVYYTLVSGTSASPVKITSTADTTSYVTSGAICTVTTFSLGNIWYDIGAGAFFYTYTKSVGSTTPAASSSANAVCPTSYTYVYTIYLGAVYANGTAYLAPLALSLTTPANSPSYIIGGGDNWLNATNIYVVYKDTFKSTGGANSATGVTYYQKITKSTSATAGSFTQLVVDTITGTFTSGAPTSAVVWNTFTPLSVWSSNFTYGIALENETYTQTSTQYTNADGAETGGTAGYTITNYLNLTSTPTGVADSGVTYSSATGVIGFWGWQLSTGYTLVAQWDSSTTNVFTWGTFYGNGTVNMTSTTLGSANGPVSFYEDVNGTQWIGWTDYDTSTNIPTMTYAGYLAKLQGQLNVASGANVLSALSVLTLFVAAIFAF